MTIDEMILHYNNKNGGERMTIAGTDREINELIQKHHVAGAEVVINALVRACKNEKYLGKDELIKLIEKSREWEAKDD